MPPTLTTRRRVVASLFVSLLVILALLLRLAFLMLVRGPDLRLKGLTARLRTIPVGAPRGEILDDRGRVLATSQTVYSVYAIPAQVRDKERVAAALSPFLAVPADRLLRRLRQRQYFVWLKRQLSPEAERSVADLGIPGIELVPETRRVYPYRDLAAQVLGFAGVDGQGLEGVELSYDRYLRGRAGAIRVELDAGNRAIPGSRVEFVAPRPGDDVRLTLDVGLQKIAARAAQQALHDTSALSDFVVIMDVRTGGILALAALPSYDPNDFQHAKPEERRDPVVSDDFPPGSTFKIVTAAAALNERVVTPHTGFFDPGFVSVNGVRLHCWRRAGHGAITFTQVVEGSCNVGFVQVGLALGTERFYQYLRRFHLLAPTGVDLPGEATSIVPAEQAVKPVDLATMAFGQTLALTPLQLLSAVAAVADGGVWHRPHVAAEVVNPEGKVVWHYADRGEQVIGPDVARTLSTLLGGVVARGTGKSARLEGYDLAGKTGTAQAVIQGRYVEGKYVSSFVGFGPLPTPRLAVLVGINQPVGPYYGGQIAAPVFRSVMAGALAYLDVPAETAVRDEIEVPDLNQKDVSQALGELHKVHLGARVLGGGARVSSQFPPPGTLVPAETEVLLFASGPAAPVVPDLRGKTVAEAVRLLDAQNLRLRLSGAGVIRSQAPRPGERVPPGSAVSAQAFPHGAQAGGR